MNTAMSFPTAARIWYQRHTPHWFLLRFWFSGIVFVLDLPDAIHLLVSRNITGGCFASHRSQIFWKSCWLQLGVHPLLFWQIFVSLSPADDPGEKPAMVLFTAIRNRSEWEQALQTVSENIFLLLWADIPISFLQCCSHPSWRLCCHASIYGNVPVMLVCSCQRTFRGFIPYIYIADEIARFSSLYQKFFYFFL